MRKRWPFLRSLRPGQVRADAGEDIREELELYLELRAEELVEREGLTPEAARREAAARFGDAARIEAELEREARRRTAKRGRMMMMGSFQRDLRYAARSFRRQPTFTLVAAVTLALALGGNTAIFSVVDAALLQALPFEDHEGLVYVNGYHLVDGQPSIRGASYPEFRDWRDRSRSFSGMAAVGSSSLSLTGEGTAERVLVELVTQEYFDVLGVSAEMGRTFLTEEHEETDAHPVGVVSSALFERRFGGDPSALGSTLVVNDRTITVVGVLPEDFGGIYLTTELWLPESQISLLTGAAVLEARGSRFLDVIARIDPSSDVGTAQAELDVIARDLQAEFPSAHEDRYGQVQSFRDSYLGSTGDLLWVLLGAGAVLLLIASANVANLLLVRSHGRTREIVLRRALGAEGSRVASQLMTESMVLAAVGGAAGLVLAYWGLRILTPMIPSGVLPGYVEPRLSASAFAFSMAVLALVGVATGLFPAVSSARVDISSRLREGAKGTGTRGGLRAQRSFVVVQVGLALVLMVGAGLLTRSFRAQLAVEVGSEIEPVLGMRMQLPRARYDTDQGIWVFARELERRLLELPGVTAASVSSDLPFRGFSSGAYIYKEGAGPEDRIRFHRHHVTAGYFETLGIELTQGRLLDDGDTDAAAPVIVITEAMAERVFPGESPIGRTMSLTPDGTMSVEIVGVLRDVRYRDVTTSLMAEANSPDVFFSFWQLPSLTLEVAVRTEGGPAALTEPLRRLVAELDPDLPVFLVQPLVDSYRAQTATPRFAAFLMSVFSGLAMILACVGIYGVLAFAVGQRTREIAIRRAVGAAAPIVAARVVTDGLKLVLVGLVVGAAASVGGARFIEEFLFGVSTTDPWTFGGVAAVMIAVAIIAAIVPAVRAMGCDPATALQSD